MSKAVPIIVFIFIVVYFFVIITTIYYFVRTLFKNESVGSENDISVESDEKQSTAVGYSEQQTFNKMMYDNLQRYEHLYYDDDFIKEYNTREKIENVLRRNGMLDFKSFQRWVDNYYPQNVNIEEVTLDKITDIVQNRANMVSAIEDSGMPTDLAKIIKDNTPYYGSITSDQDDPDRTIYDTFIG